MKLFILIIVIISSFFLSQCTSRTNTNDRIYNFLNDKPQHFKNNEDSNSSTTKSIDTSKQLKYIESTIKKTCKAFNIQNLKEKKLLIDEIEIRIWGEGVENSSVNCFILQRKNQKWLASLTSAPVGDDGEYKKTKQGEIILNKQAFLSPKSGWKDLEDYLIQKGIHVPLPYSLDTEESSPILDERTIDLEIKEGEKYSLVSYREFTKSIDGQIIIKVCSSLEKEFNIVIGCSR